MQGQTLIQAQGLSRYYGNHCAVEHLDINLRQGEILGLLGPNGAGKSTTLQMLSGCLAPGSGEIRICDIDLLESPRAAKQNIGYLPERPPLYSDLTVDEYLRYSARLRRVPRREISAAVQQTQTRCGLDGMQKKLIRNLSKGFQQRVGIAQAIVHSPKVVILDEPTVALDPVQIREIRNLIRELGDKHSVILSTHLLPEVQTLCDRVQILVEGKTVFSESLASFESQQTAHTLLVEFRQPPLLESIRMLPGVKNIEVLTELRLKISYDGRDTTRAQLATMSVDQQWALIELTPQKSSLEQVFMDLVYRESGTDSNLGKAA